MPAAIQPTQNQWDAFIRRQPHAHPLQLSGWGALKSAFGWSHQLVALNEDNEIIGGALLLFRRLPLRLGTMAYLPMGPYLAEARTTEDPLLWETLWGKLWNAIDDCARAHKAAFLKWEPGLRADLDPSAHGFKPSPQTVQPPRTILIDISGDEDAIMARMNQGTRRKIRQAYKKGATYYTASVDDVSQFGQMMQTTGDRNDFGVHGPAYYRMAYDLFAPDDACLFMAEHDGDILAGNMAFAVGKTAWYLYGASSNTKRNLMASYGVQWEAIRWAKERGCTHYDMWGVPDEDEPTLEAEFQERSDGLWGVYGFKRGFGGQVVRSLGAWDKVYNPGIYTAYKTALRLRG